MKALIDADMPANELGGITDEDGVLLPWEDIQPLAKGRFVSILIKSEAGGFRAFLSKGETFRHRLASIAGYKANRDPAKRPHYAPQIKQYYADTFGAEFCDGYEADDAMAMEQWADWSYLAKLSNYDEEYIKDNSSTVICSRDKDLNTVPGWHFSWTLKREAEKRAALGEVHVEKPPYYITMIEGLRNFYKQMLTGDTVDNIQGLYNIGPKSAWVKQIDEMDNEAQMYEHVKEKYFKYFGNWWRVMLIETGSLLHLWRKPNDVWVPPDSRDMDWYDV
jgi:5'-3' exonuclease